MPASTFISLQLLHDLSSRLAHAGTWDVRQHGLVYALATGPYGVLLALCWDRDAPGSPSNLVMLGSHPGVLCTPFAA